MHILLFVSNVMRLLRFIPWRLIRFTYRTIMALYRIDASEPLVHSSAYVAESAVVIGSVEIAENASIWDHVSIRGDNETIRIGPRSNVQEGCVLHADVGYPLQVGADVTVGHQAMLHGCIVEDGALIGIQAVVLNGARIGKNCLVGAGALVTEGKTFEEGMLIIGRPAKAIRQLTELELIKMRLGSEGYVQKTQQFKKGLKRVG